MAKTNLQKMADKLNDEFRLKIAKTMKENFDIEVETTYNIFAMRLVSNRTDGEDFTPEQHSYLAAYSEGFGEAMNIVSEGL